MKNNHKKAQTDIKPWTWHRAWGITLPIPRTRDGEKLLAEGNISLKQAVVWVMFASAIYAFLIISPSLFMSPTTVSLQSILILIGGSLLSGLLSSISFVLITGVIHSVAKLFRSKGVWENFFIVYTVFSAPVIILYGIAVSLYQIFSLKLALSFGMVLPFYWLLVICPVAIKVNYQFRWWTAFLINLFVIAIFFFSIVGLFIVFNPGIL